MYLNAFVITLQSRMGRLRHGTAPVSKIFFILSFENMTERPNLDFESLKNWIILVDS